MLVRYLALMCLCIVAGCATEPCPSADAVLAMPRSGLIQVEGGRVWYNVQGTGRGSPLLVLHGGPGIPHDYLENLAELGDERPVIFYDQLGCGKSDRPDNQALWTRERFARELDQVRHALGLREVVLYGHSWGSILAMDYIAGRGDSNLAPPTGIRGVILAGPALSIPVWRNDSRRLIDTLGPDTAKTIDDAERNGATDSKAYQDALQLFYSRYLCRLDPWPEPIARALANMNPAIYSYMNGPSEFTTTGTLKDVDVTPDLRQIDRPTLLICGEFDEATPRTTHSYASLTTRATAVVIPGAAHLANYDQPEAYMNALRAWMHRHRL
jgi:proline iminopeptidase